MDDVTDNAAVFLLLADQFPDEHITHCVDTQLVTRNSTMLDDPEDPNRRLLSVGYVLKCPHVHSFEVSVHMTIKRAHGTPE